jgi:hypothetical protein
LLQKNNSQALDKRVILWYNGGVVTGRGTLEEGGLTNFKKYDIMEGYPIIYKTIVYCL